jgi:hypothetical protein
VSTVSVLCARRGVVVGSQRLENKKESERQTVRTLLEVLDLHAAGLSLDVLRIQGYSSITQAQRQIAHGITKLCSLLE